MYKSQIYNTVYWKQKINGVLTPFGTKAPLLQYCPHTLLSELRITRKSRYMGELILVEKFTEQQNDSFLFLRSMFCVITRIVFRQFVVFAEMSAESAMKVADFCTIYCAVSLTTWQKTSVLQTRRRNFRKVLLSDSLILTPVSCLVVKCGWSLISVSISWWMLLSGCMKRRLQSDKEI